MERSKAQEAANILQEINLYEKVISILQGDEPLQWASILGMDVEYTVLDELRAGLLRHFRKTCEYHIAKLQEL